jgi:uncharacterized glyoxalase superfamily protein PhnB
MAAHVNSVFLYVDDVLKSLEFYNEIVGAEISQVWPPHALHDGEPITLAILRIGSFRLMLHPQDEHAEEFADTRVGVGIHLQLRVDDRRRLLPPLPRRMRDAQRLGRPTDQILGTARVRAQDPDGYVWSIYHDNSGGSMDLIEGRSIAPRIAR